MWKEVGSQGRFSEERKPLYCRSTGCQGDRVAPLWLKEQPSKTLDVRGRCPCYPFSHGWHWTSEVAQSLDVIKIPLLHWSIALWRMELLPPDRPPYTEYKVLSLLLALSSVLAHLYNIGVKFQVQAFMTLRVNSLSRCPQSKGCILMNPGSYLQPGW